MFLTPHAVQGPAVFNFKVSCSRIWIQWSMMGIGVFCGTLRLQQWFRPEPGQAKKPMESLGEVQWRKWGLGGPFIRWRLPVFLRVCSVDSVTLDEDNLLQSKELPLVRIRFLSHLSKPRRMSGPHTSPVASRQNPTVARGWVINKQREKQELQGQVTRPCLQVSICRSLRDYQAMLESLGKEITSKSFLLLPIFMT